MLAGYRILDLTDELAVYGTRLLAELGAEVIKVEPPTGDPLRRQPPFYEDVPHPERSLPFIAWNTNKKSLTLNLHCADGRALLSALLPGVDALVLSAPPNDPLYEILDYTTLRQHHPALVFTTASGFGLQGPHASYLSSDLIGQAMGGVMWMSGPPDRPPTQPGGNLSYLLTGLYVATGTMLALWHRQRTGEGQHVDVSQQDCVASILAEFGAASYWATEEIPMRYGTHRPDFFPNGLYPCRDGYLMLIVVPTDWPRFAQWVYEVTGNRTVLDPRFELNEARILPEARAILNPILREFTHCFASKEILFHEGQKRHFLFAPVNTVADLLRDRHLQARGFWQPLQQPGLPPLTSAGQPVHSNRLAWTPLQPAPALGQHNLEIYAGELGLSPHQLACLKERHVI
jgi:crotonobetainyl-CoA:carnitine CoA-transferase CaiB-like acyl-CoA transferase